MVFDSGTRDPLEIGVVFDEAYAAGAALLPARSLIPFVAAAPAAVAADTILLVRRVFISLLAGRPGRNRMPHTSNLVVIHPPFQDADGGSLCVSGL